MNKLISLTTLVLAAMFFVACESDAVDTANNSQQPSTAIENNGGATVPSKDMGDYHAPSTSSQYTDQEVMDLILRFEQERYDILTSSVPAVVIQGLNAAFPNATQVEWEYGGGIYEVEFEIDRREYEAYFDEQGNLMMYKVDMNYSEIPQVVKDAIYANYQGYNIDDVNMVVLPGGAKYYEVDIEDRNDRELAVIINEAGQIVDDFID
ncbi:MAG: PepSY-like domain-containing protein [Bacteroidales bacterium]|jgi:hypothetical protein|nr:PepSY-like domain-containing protein [Bacteroidales bacterium]